MQFYAHLTDKDQSGFTYLQYVHNKTRLWIMIKVLNKNGLILYFEAVSSESIYLFTNKQSLRTTWFVHHLSI